MKLGHKIIPSQLKPVRKGVLRGSILAPFLFLLFVNDIPLHLNNSTIDIHADDTTLSLSANWNNITSLINRLLLMIWRILRNGQLKTELYINTKKTKALLVMEKRLQPTLRAETASLQLHLNATNINQILHHKLLRLIIDKDLSFGAHIDELCIRNCQNDFDF